MDEEDDVYLGDPMPSEDPEEPYEPDYDDDECDYCGGEMCPFCCPNNGTYTPGTEECEGCVYTNECVNRTQGQKP